MHTCIMHAHVGQSMRTHAFDLLAQTFACTLMPLPRNHNSDFCIVFFVYFTCYASVLILLLILFLCLFYVLLCLYDLVLVRFYIYKHIRLLDLLFWSPALFLVLLCSWLGFLWLNVRAHNFACVRRLDYAYVWSCPKTLV